MVPILLALATVLALIGLSAATRVTFGVFLVGSACLLAIMARIAQSHAQHRELLPAPLPSIAPVEPELDADQQLRRARAQRSEKILIAVLLVVVVLGWAAVSLWKELYTPTATPAATASPIPESEEEIQKLRDRVLGRPAEK